MTHRFVIVPVVAGALVLAVGCASRSFVREELQTSETGLEQRLRRLETDLSRQKTRLSRIAPQVMEARSSADEAKTRADQAASTADQALSKVERAEEIADQALAMAEETDRRLRRFLANRYERELVKTVVITFSFDKWELDAAGQDALVGVVKELKENPNLGVDLVGHTDSAGSALYNLELSQRRVETVRRFLAGKGVDLHRIQSIGLGELRPLADNTTQGGRARNRRAAIKLFIPTE
ncbi:MAG: OmpA family protein [Candidatus Methylomirabilia bacterium]